MKELAEFLSTGPSLEQLLAYRPTESLQERALDLVEKSKEGHLTEQEHSELDQFVLGERFIRSIKAKIHLRKATRQ
jgi:hypothetical protein